MSRLSMLVILDGFGLAPAGPGNAIEAARKPHLDELFSKYPHTTLRADGLFVGLPEGQMGNSEVGHLNIGGGRIIYQDLTLITKEIEEGKFFENPELNAAVDHALENDSTLHLMGLVSDGGVHSHITHILALLDLAKKRGLKRVCLHCFLDGRDVPPTSAEQYIDQVEKHMKEIGVGEIALISGRYYAMDRDKRWDRLERAYDAQTLGRAPISKSAKKALKTAYEAGETDEFVQPVLVAADGKPRLVSDGDSIIFFNFRPDRARELTRAYVDPAFDGFKREKIVNDLKYVCMTQYDETMPNVTLAYPPETYVNTLGEYVSKQGLKQLRIAETEKYAHVTFFFNGGVEAPNPNEDRVLIPSPKVATYDLQPQMSAYEITDRVLEEIVRDKYDLIILNFANADMVGHTGVFDAAVKAIETLDACVPRIVDAVLAKGGQLLITADHGNADEMLDAEGKVVTAHSTNPVPLVLVAADAEPLSDGGKLADIAPTLLYRMGLAQPPEMSGRNLCRQATSKSE